MKYILPIILTLSMLFISCEANKSTDRLQAEETEQMVRQSQQMIGMPEITNFTERRIFKEILEKRDQVFPTYTYIMDMNGNLHFLCNSIGYGIPFATQFTNPQYIASRYSQGGFAILPQPDPNGLFMPTNADATYVLCGTENDNEPQYVEQEILVTTFEIDLEKW